jgi:hypothetical protein
MLKKNILLKYGQYLKESTDPWKLKQTINSFNRLPQDMITIPGDFKDLSETLTKEFFNLKLPYIKTVNFGGIEIDVKIFQSNRYYSNIDWLKFLTGHNEMVIEVNHNYDINYVISTIIHEIRHIIDFTDENLNVGLSSFDIDRNLRKYNINIFNEFFILIYISLEHELVARNNQIYPYIKFKNLKKEDSFKILESSFIWKALNMLNDFNYIDFIDKFNEKDLINITNNFIKDCLYDNDTSIENKEDLINFYKTFNDYFKEISYKWKNILTKEVDIIYERKIFNIETIEDYKIIIKNIWTEIKK